jgi:phosphocarrier protein
MPDRTATIASPVGLHARPAAAFVKAVIKSGVPVMISKQGQPPVDGRSMVSVITLNVAQGDEVVLHAEGEGAEAVLDDLVAMLQNPDV